jgi:hypothetical protein
MLESMLLRITVQFTGQNIVMWSSCILTSLHSLTGPVGLPFASCLGGQRFTPPGLLPHFWNWDLLLAMFLNSNID